MKLSIWDIFSVVTLAGILVLGMVFATIFSNPYTPLNPFPPATLPALVTLPSPTATSIFPATWTPTSEFGQTPAVDVMTPTPSETSTVYALPTFTATLEATFTFTPSQTPTSTLTPTPTRTNTPAPAQPSNTPHPSNTPTPQPTITTAPSKTVAPSNTPAPSHTPAPSNTPGPTNSPTPGPTNTQNIGG